MPSKVGRVNVIRKEDGSVTIKWQVPLGKGGPDLKYRIKYGNKVVMTTNTNITIHKGAKRMEYLVSVCFSLFFLY